MAEKSSFFNSVSHDRRYAAEDWAAYFSSFVSNGVFAKPSDGLQVMALTGMSITIKAGSGFINGYYYRNTTDLVKMLVVADGVLSRIDRVVVRWSLIDRAIFVAVKQGEPASNPVAKPLQRDAEAYELALADVYIGAGVTSIVQSNITDRRASSELCGFVTGVIDQLDFSTLTTQFEAFFSEYRERIKDDYNAFDTTMGEFEESAQSDFAEWFENLKYVLDGDAAGHLQAEIEAMQESLNHIQADQIVDSAVTAEKIAANAVSTDYTATIDTGWGGTAAPYWRTVTIPGILESDTPIIDLRPSATIATAEAQIEAWGYVYRALTAANVITFYATEKPTVSLPIKIKVVRK